LVLEANAGLVSKTSLTLHASHIFVAKINFKIAAPKRFSQSYQNFVIMLPDVHKIQPKFPPPPYLSYFPMLYLASSLPVPEGRAATGKLQSNQFSVSPVIIIIIIIIINANSMEQRPS
jgi:hypothetical protein